MNRFRSCDGIILPSVERVKADPPRALEPTLRQDPQSGLQDDPPSSTSIGPPAANSSQSFLVTKYSPPKLLTIS
ncbi:hypothetical protein F9C07_11211 [Aspergillus flavus]|uniref:Uncharacterized protein n=1 Tax=Aspergillus flavus (strain ATCC 200026 / FGSC A1120 / IAM 13836 / NRRL 3357 / JCM 12722 / SRRC 167) TaxID=332952 RepID=A0A7U2MSM6_ASPFN|nr:hypothetical protein F9C07_11211 [Aspergillus flavus]